MSSPFSAAARCCSPATPPTAAFGRNPRKTQSGPKKEVLSLLVVFLVPTLPVRKNRPGVAGLDPPFLEEFMRTNPTLDGIADAIRELKDRQD
jgi:hypothetical protein